MSYAVCGNSVDPGNGGTDPDNNDDNTDTNGGFNPVFNESEDPETPIVAGNDPICINCSGDGNEMSISNVIPGFMWVEPDVIAPNTNNLAQIQ